MQEHEPRHKEEDHKGGNATFSPSDKQRKTIALVNKLFDKAKAARSQHDAKWLGYYKMFRGRQWDLDRPSFRHSEVINMVFQNIQAMVPIMTDSRPKISFLPTEPADKDFAELLNDVLDADWETNNWLQELTQVIYDSHFYGTGVSRLEYDPDENFGLGGIVYERADPFYCFPDPDATDVNKKSDFFIYAEPMDTEKLRKKYPKHKEYIKPDLLDFIDSDKGTGGSSSPKLQRILDPDMPFDGTTNMKAHSQDQSLVITCYVKDKEVEEKKVKNEEGETEYEQRLKFPKGRKIVLISGVPVEDTDFPYDDGEFPYSRMINYTDPGRFWGISEIEQLESPQKIFNKLVSFTLDVLTLMGNPVWVVDYSSGVDPENLVNRPGLVIEKEPGSEVRREAGTQLQPYVMQMIDRTKQWFDQVSGVSDVSRGAAAGGVTAASAIESLQDAAQTRIRLKMRNMDGYLRTVGKQYASRALQFYRVPRVVRVVGKGQAEMAAQFFRFEVEDRDGGKVGKATPFDKDGRAEIENQMEFILKGEFDVRATTSSGLPFAKAEKERRLLNLFDRGIIDAEEVLRGIELPNWEAILERVQAKQAEAAQAEQQQGQ